MVEWNENLITLTEATKLIPSRPHLSTLWRWYTIGCGGKKLETWKIGGRRYTTREALTRFVIAGGSSEQSEKPTSPLQWRRDFGRAEGRANQLGI